MKFIINFNEPKTITKILLKHKNEKLIEILDILKHYYEIFVKKYSYKPIEKWVQFLKNVRTELREIIPGDKYHSNLSFYINNYPLFFWFMDYKTEYFFIYKF